AFQLKLEHRLVERVQKSRRLEIVDARKVAPRRQAEVGEELLRRRIEQGPAGPLTPAGGARPTRIHQHVERSFGDLHATDRLDFGAADGLVIGDDRQRFRGRARQPPRLLARAAKQVCEIGRRLEVPAPAALDQLDPPAFIMRREVAERDLHVAVADMLDDFVDAERRRRGEQGGFDGAGEFVHYAALSLMGANASSCANSRRPLRASSSIARKLDANADRRNCGSCVWGRKLSSTVQSSTAPIIRESRSSASSSVSTARAWTTCIAGCVRARTTP